MVAAVFAGFGLLLLGLSLLGQFADAQRGPAEQPWAI
jgi:hypothetical protein